MGPRERCRANSATSNQSFLQERSYMHKPLPIMQHPTYMQIYTRRIPTLSVHLAQYHKRIRRARKLSDRHQGSRAAKLFKLMRYLPTGAAQVHGTMAQLPKTWGSFTFTSKACSCQQQGTDASFDMSLQGTPQQFDNWKESNPTKGSRKSTCVDKFPA